MSADNTTLANKNFAKRKYQNNKNRNRRSEWRGNLSLVAAINIWYDSTAVKKGLFLLRWLPEQF